MKVLHVSESDDKGGAAKAAYRIHRSLRTRSVNSHMRVNRYETGDGTVEGPKTNIDKFIARARPIIGTLFTNAISETSDTVIQSSNVLPSRWPRRLNNSDNDIVHLHWVNNEMLSIPDIGKIRKPTVWTLHDMWAFCGAEHYANDLRWCDGYQSKNRSSCESGFDLNRWTWQRKKKYWQHAIQIVAPSTWLSECVKKSVLLGDWPTIVIPNAIDTEVWKPIDRAQAREMLGIDPNNPVALFGAFGGIRDSRKGFDLLIAALQRLETRIDGLQLVVFGQRAPDEPLSFLDSSVHYTGHLHDELSLRVVYSAADVFIIPSRQDNLPNTGLEALACGTPVVAFDCCGMPDIVEHKKTGYLAKAYDPGDLAEGIEWTVRSQNANFNSDGAKNSELSWLGLNARKRAEERFSYPIVSDQYLKLYQNILNIEAVRFNK